MKNPNAIYAICPDGVVRTATYRGTYSPTTRAFVRVRNDKSGPRVLTVTGRVRISLSGLAPTFTPDAGLTNSEVFDK